MEKLASKQDRQKLKSGFDVRNNPRLLESRKRDPSNIMIVISFSDNSFIEMININSMFALESVFLTCDNSRKGTVKKCKRAAEGCSRQLQKLVKKMPSHLGEKVSV